MRKIKNRIAVGDTRFVELEDIGENSLLGFRLADGRLLWRRTTHAQDVLTASAGGMFYLVRNIRTVPAEIIKLQGIDGLTGTQLWSVDLPEHNVPLTGEWGIDANNSRLLQGPSWRIGPDGAIYRVKMKETFKLQ